MSMKLKRYKASSMPLALQQVKRDIGSDAVIVHTRTIKQGGFLGMGSKTVVEITARKGSDAQPRPRHINTNTQRLQRAYIQGSSVGGAETTRPNERLNVNRISSESDTKAVILNEEIESEIGHIKQLVENLVTEQRQLHAPNMPEQLFELYLNLVQQEVADEVAQELISHVQRDLTGNQMDSSHVIRQKLVEVMEKMVDTAGPVCCNINGSPRTVALIGPTGVGKTTTIAKLAAHFKINQNKKVGLITIDTYRMGAVDQLRMYAEIIDVPLKVVLTPTELREAIMLMDDTDIIFIDTAGRSQNDELKMKELKTFLNAAKPDEVHLVLSTNAHHEQMVNVAEKFKKLGIDRVIFTKLDEAISFGVIFSVLKKVDASLSYITTGQDVPEDIEVGNSNKLAQMLLGIEKPESHMQVEA